MAHLESIMASLWSSHMKYNPFLLSSWPFVMALSQIMISRSKVTRTVVHYIADRVSQQGCSLLGSKAHFICSQIVIPGVRRVSGCLRQPCVNILSSCLIYMTLFWLLWATIYNRGRVSLVQKTTWQLGIGCCLLSLHQNMRLEIIHTTRLGKKAMTTGIWVFRDLFALAVNDTN